MYIFIKVKRLFKCRKVVVKFLHCDFGVYLCSSDISMPEDTADTLDGHTLIESKDGKTVSGAMHSDMLSNPAFVHYSVDAFGHCPVFHRRKDIRPFLMVLSDYFKRDIKQLYLEGNLGLMSLGDNPSSPVDRDNI